MSATYLKGVGLVRRNNEFHHFDVLGTAGVITDASGAVLSSNVYDAFGVARYVSGNAQTQWRWLLAEEEGLVHISKEDYLPQWGVVLQQPLRRPTEADCKAQFDLCKRDVDRWFQMMMGILGVLCLGGIIGAFKDCLHLCTKLGAPNLIIGCQILCPIVLACGCFLAGWWIQRQAHNKDLACWNRYRDCLRRANGHVAGPITGAMASASAA